MPFLSALTDRGRRIEAHRPWPRIVVDVATWRQAIVGLAAGEATLLGLWSDGEAVHMGLIAEAKILVISLPVPKRRYPSVGLSHAPALRLERMIRDLYGLEPEGLPDVRPWFDHGRWGISHPLGARRPPPATGSAYPFLEAEGPPLHQIPVGPVHAGIIEPGHFRFTANGETVVRLEERLGYVHKGIEGLMAGALPERAAKLAGRVSGDSTVAYAIAFAHGDGGRAGDQRAAACYLAARTDGRAGAPRQPFRRHRGDLQRCLLLAHARPLRRATRAGAPCLRGVFWPSAHDGSRGARRDCG